MEGEDEMDQRVAQLERHVGGMRLRLDEHSTTFQEHGRLLQHHSAMLTDQTKKLEENTTTTKAIKADTQILVDFAAGLKGFQRFIFWCGRVVKFVGVYVAPIAAAVMAGVAYVKGGGR